MPIYRLPVQINYSGPGAPGVNVWNVRTAVAGGGSLSQLDLASQALSTFYNSLVQLVPTSMSWSYAGEVVVANVEDPPRVVSPPWVRVGTGAATYAPQLLAIVAGMRTGTATRSGMGRVFLGPWGYGVLAADGTPVDANLTTIRNSLQTLLSASLADNGWAIGVYSKKQNLFRDATGFVVRDKWAYLSSRRD